MYSEINKDNLNDILRDLGKEYRKRGGKHTPTEIIMVGGGAILANYGFRELSYDIDAIIHASSALKDAAIAVRDKYNLAPNWLNSDFKKTDSYSTKLYQHSQYYRTFSNTLTIRTVSPEYLVAMKMKSARLYKHDLSDIAGIIIEEKAKNPKFSKQTIMTAYQDMYGDAEIKKEVRNNLDAAFSTTNPTALLKQIREYETIMGNVAGQFENEYPNILNENNIDSILRTLHQKRTTNTDSLIKPSDAATPNETQNTDDPKKETVKKKPAPRRFGNNNASNPEDDIELENDLEECDPFKHGTNPELEELVQKLREKANQRHDNPTQVQETEPITSRERMTNGYANGLPLSARPQKDDTGIDGP